MTYYTADSYKNWERVDEPFDRDGRKYTIVKHACDRCGGTGVYSWGAVINGSPQYAGSCFKCDGTGVEQKTVRLYTESEYNSMQRSKEKRRVARKIKRKLSALEKWFQYNGFNEKGETYLIFGNTYPIKDQLKAAGCKFSSDLKWHSPKEIEIPEDCFIEKIDYFNVYDWSDDYGMEPLEEGKAFLKKIFSKNAVGAFIGEIGERLRNLTVTFIGMESFDGKFGKTHMYRFNFEDEQLVWFTTSEKDLQKGEQYILSGTVKSHEIYRNAKMTYLNRCTVK